MSIYQIIAIIITLTGLSAWLNTRFLKLPNSVGILFISSILSIFLIIFGKTSIVDVEGLANIISSIDFKELLLHGVLAILLFASTLNIPIDKLWKYKISIILSSTLGVFISALVTGYLLYFIALLLSFNIPLVYCFIFGALIAPTDPIAVLSILKKTTSHEQLKIKLAGESLFNDGAGIVLFILLIGLANKGPDVMSSINYLEVLGDLGIEIIGSILLGIFCSAVILFFIKTISNSETQIILTISLAIGSYALAESIHVSAPITTVVAGIFLANNHSFVGVNPVSKKQIELFWKLLDEIINSVLFFLIGIEVVLIDFSLNVLAISILAIISVLLGRYIGVISCSGIVYAFKRTGNFKSVPVLLTWAGLRGGISIALALSLPMSEYKEIILSLTYITVLFSILFQGLTLHPIIKFLDKRHNVVKEMVEQ